MRNFRFIISRVFIVALNIVAQVVFFSWLVYVISNEIVYLYTALRVLVFLFIVFVLNKDMSPSYKLPWIIVLLVFPLFGGVIFILFGNNNLSRRNIKRFQNEAKKSKDVFHHNEENINKLKQVMPEYYLQAQYLSNRTGLPISNHNNVIYLSDGVAYLNKLLEEIKKARNYIFIEYFIIDKGIMWDQILTCLREKLQEGITIKIIYDDIGSSSCFTKKYCKELINEGFEIYAFNRFIPILTVTHDHRDHRKIVVIDGMKAFTGGINLADEYIHQKDKHGYWQDGGIYIEGEAVHNFTKLFIEMWNVCCSHKKRIIKQIDYYQYFRLTNDIPRNLYDDKAMFVLPFGDGPAPYYIDHLGEENYMNMINMAKKYIYITTPYFIVDYGLLQAIKLAAKKGIDVRIVLPHIPDKYFTHLLTKSHYQTLIASGVKIYEFTPGFIHNKLCVVDDCVAFIGSINFDYRSLVHHFECGVWLGSYESSSSIIDMKTDIETIMSKSELMTPLTSKLKWYEKIIRNFLILFASLM